MPSQAASPQDLKIQPVTPERWPDLEALFGEHGAYGGCWCMWWRLTRSEFAQQLGQGNKDAFKRIVEAGEIPGLLACADGRPVAWCSVAPRETFPALERSRTLKRVDDQPVWSIVCFFVAKSARGKGFMLKLLRAAVEHAKAHGAKIVEGYPIEPTGSLSGSSGFTGVVSTFRQAGFVEVLRRSETRPIMRYVVGERR
jgi:GNAT superfamily N-acetyltransferase